MPVPTNRSVPTPTVTPTTPTPVGISSQDMAKWNQFIDYNKAKGYSGMKELDHDPALRAKIFNEYNKANPDKAVSQDMVSKVQEEIQNYKNKSLDAIQKGKQMLSEGVTPTNYMKGISKVDNVYGSKTSSWKFPEAYMVNKQTAEKKNLGFANQVDLTSMKKP